MSAPTRILTPDGLRPEPRRCAFCDGETGDDGLPDDSLADHDGGCL